MLFNIHIVFLICHSAFSNGAIRRHGSHPGSQTDGESSNGHHLDQMKHPVMVKWKQKVERYIAGLHSCRQQIEQYCHCNNSGTTQFTGQGNEQIDCKSTQHRDCFVNNKGEKFTGENLDKHEEDSSNTNTPWD
jgi:hypothetical protein